MRTSNGRDDGEPISPYPEGGRQAWATVFGAWVNSKLGLTSDIDDRPVS